MDKKLYDNLDNFNDVYSLLEFINEEAEIKPISDAELLANLDSLETVLTEAKKLSDMKADLLALKDKETNKALGDDAELLIDKVAGGIASAGAAEFVKENIFLVAGILGIAVNPTTSWLLPLLFSGLTAAGVCLTSKTGRAAIKKLYNKFVDKLQKYKKGKIAKAIEKRIDKLEDEYRKPLTDEQKDYIRLQLIPEAEVEEDNEIQQALDDIKAIDKASAEKLIDTINSKLVVNI